MCPRPSLLALVLLLFPLWTTRIQAQDADELESVYASWRAAMAEGNVQGWRAATSSRRQIELENEIVSRGQAFPQALFADEVAPPPLGGLALIASRQSQVAAHLFYFGRVNFGLVDTGEIPRGLLMLRFLREDRGWRFDSLTYYNFADRPEVEAELAAGRVDSLNGPEFAPPERLPAPAERVGPPERVAQLYIRCPLHRVQARINGVDHTYEAAGDVGVSTVIGGLERGANQIRFGVAELPGAPHPYPQLPEAERASNNATLEISLWLVSPPGDAPAPPRLVWRWTADEPGDLPQGPTVVEFELE